MRNLFILLVFSLVGLNLNAQNAGGCGTVTPLDYEHNLSVEQRSQVVSAPPSQRGAVLWVPIWYHIITKNDGTGGESLKDIFDSHCELNEYFVPIGIGFYIKGIDTIKNTTYWNYQTSLGSTIFNQYNRSNSCNVYVNGNLPGLCGFATFPFSGNNGGGIFLNKSCVGADTKTFPHEMGHYLNLPHTFDSWGSNVEFVDGSNCATAGDGFCDTPADFVDYRASCPYLGDSTDPHGDLYRTVIDETLFMSYFADNCISVFSNEEQAEMISALTNQRSNLLNQTLPDMSALDSAVFITPLTGDTTVNSTSVQIKWHAVPNAKYYNLRLQSASSTLVYADTMIVDTAFTVNGLTPNKSYKFRIRSFSFGNTCGENAPYQFIQTSTIKSTVTVTSSTCAGDNNAVVAVNPTNGTNPYTFDWSNGSTGSPLTNVAPGTYTVTVTDNNGEVVVANVVVVEPTPLSVTVNQVGNNLNAYGSGGSSPYTYAWSNGVNSQFNNNITFGDYSVTITDSKGCTTVQTIVYSSVGVDMETTVAMKIFPNPLYQTEQFFVQVSLNEPAKGTIVLMNAAGEVIHETEENFLSGLNSVSVSTRQIASGIYFVQFRSDEAVKTERISVIR